MNPPIYRAIETLVGKCANVYTTGLQESVGHRIFEYVILNRLWEEVGELSRDTLAHS